MVNAWLCQEDLCFPEVARQLVATNVSEASHNIQVAGTFNEYLLRELCDKTEMK